MPRIPYPIPEAEKAFKDHEVYKKQGDLGGLGTAVDDYKNTPSDLNPGIEDSSGNVWGTDLYNLYKRSRVGQKI